MLPKVSIVILNWKNYEDTKECFDSLLKTTYQNCEVVFVDNGSPDGSGDLLHKEYPDFPYVQTGENLGFSGGCNAGIEYALKNNADYIMLLNNDTTVKYDFIEPLVNEFEEHPDAGITTGKGFYYDTPDILHMAGAEMDWMRSTYQRYGADELDKGQYDQAREVGFASAYFMLVKQEVFGSVQLLSEDYFGGVEECEFNIRVKKAGYKIYYTPDSVMWHKISRSFKPATIRGVYNTYRNKLIFMKKFLSPVRWQLWSIGFGIYARTLGLYKRVKRAKSYGHKIGILKTLKAINLAIRDSKIKNKVTISDLEQFEE